MLLVVLLGAWLTGLASGSGRVLHDLRTLLLAGDVSAFLARLEGCELDDESGGRVIGVICEHGVGYRALAAVLAKLGGQPRDIECAMRGAANGGHVGLLAGLAEEGNAVLGGEALVLQRGVSAGHLGVAVFCAELGGSFSSFSERGFAYFDLQNSVRGHDRRVIYYLAGQGADVDASLQLGMLIGWLGACSQQCDYELASFLLARLQETQHISALVGVAVRSGDTRLLARLLEQPEVVRYLREAKCAGRVLAEQRRDAVWRLLEPPAPGEDEAGGGGRYQMQWGLRRELRREFSRLVRAAHEGAAPLEPLTGEDVECLFALPSDLFSVVFVLVLGLAVCPEKLS